MEWEIQWIINNPKYYSGKMHQKSVVQNIIKRYKIIELEKTIKELLYDE